jgi:hypothetical protein
MSTHTIVVDGHGDLPVDAPRRPGANSNVVDRLIQDEVTRIMLCTGRITPGRSHADGEIPELVAHLRARHPALAIDHAWPFDAQDVASFLSSHVNRHLRRSES